MPTLARATNYKLQTTNCRQRRHGLTLVELLIAISIIGILAVVMLSSFNPGLFLADSRDAQRKEDIQNIATALQLYYTEVGNFPWESTNGCDTSRGLINTWCSNASSNNWDTATANYIYNKLVTAKQVLKGMPKDPKNNSTYYYRYEPNASPINAEPCQNITSDSCQLFWIGARLESTDTGKELMMVYRCTNDTSLGSNTGCQVVEFTSAGPGTTNSFDDPAVIK